jgi:hypothetical protein
MATHCTTGVPEFPTLYGTAADASDTTQTKGGKAIFVRIGEPANLKFTSFAEKYAYLRGKSACSDGTIPFPCRGSED